MSAEPPSEPVAAPDSWGPLARASSSLVALVVTFLLYVLREGPTEEGVIVGFVTAAHASIWSLVGEWLKLKRQRELGRGVSSLLLIGTLAGLGGAVATGGGCGSVELRDDGVPCVIEAARVAAELAATVVAERDPLMIATLATAHLVRLTQVCLEWDAAGRPVEVIVPIDSSDP